ncbi:hypothetical protein ABBQ38_012109 [Trebouxia sp. C0009 RCD-2024]
MNSLAITDYEGLQNGLLSRCTKAATFLRQTDLTAWQIVTDSDPQAIKEVVASPSDYGAFPDVSIACLKQKSDQITLLLPFRDHIGTSINIWKPFWEIDKEFSVRISQPVGSYKGKPVYFDMDRAYFSVVNKGCSWGHKLQQVPQDHKGPLTDFERAADIFVQLLNSSEQ